MQIIRYELPRKDIIINCLSDTHIGSILCAEDKLRETIERIKNQNELWMHLGDWINAIKTNDKRYYHGIERLLPMEQADEAIRWFAPIAKQGIVGLQGNHERALHRYGDIAQYICNALGISYGTFTAVVIFTYNKKICFKMFLHHSIFQFRSNAKDPEQMDANIKASLKMRLKNKMGDCAVMLCANAHLLKTVKPVRILYISEKDNLLKQHYTNLQKVDYSAEYIHPDLRWYGCTGSFERLYGIGISGYAEYAGFDPREIGYLRLHIQDCEPVLLEEVII